MNGPIDWISVDSQETRSTESNDNKKLGGPHSSHVKIKKRSIQMCERKPMVMHSNQCHPCVGWVNGSSYPAGHSVEFLAWIPTYRCWQHSVDADHCCCFSSPPSNCEFVAWRWLWWWLLEVHGLIDVVVAVWRVCIDWGRRCDSVAARIPWSDWDVVIRQRIAFVGYC